MQLSLSTSDKRVYYIIIETKESKNTVKQKFLAS